MPKLLLAFSMTAISMVAFAQYRAPQANASAETPVSVHVQEVKAADTESKNKKEEKEGKKSEASAPNHLSIPAIGLQSRIVAVGVNSEGDMDVPSGSTNDVGWYKGGTLPGERGAAVLDAHVFAAFSRLHELSRGDEIMVAMDNGEQKRFVVTKTKLYKLEDLSPKELFTHKGGRYIHLITCAGQPTPDGKGYTHRTVVYAELTQ